MSSDVDREFYLFTICSESRGNKQLSLEDLEEKDLGLTKPMCECCSIEVNQQTVHDELDTWDDNDFREQCTRFIRKLLSGANAFLCSGNYTDMSRSVDVILASQQTRNRSHSACPTEEWNTALTLVSVHRQAIRKQRETCVAFLARLVYRPK